MQKWMRLIKWNNGFWKAVIIIGEYSGNQNLQIVEVVDDGGIFTIPKTDLLPYKSGYSDKKKWK